MEDKDVHIVYLPPMTVAATHFSGTAEYGVRPDATSMIEQFVYETELLKHKPDAREMGFDCSNKDFDFKIEVGITPTAYEAWVKASERYEEGDGPCFEETLNYSNLMNNGERMEDTQLDLLLPIKDKHNK